MNEPMITDRRGSEEGVRRFACPADGKPVPRQAAEAGSTCPRLPLRRRIAAAFPS